MSTQKGLIVLISGRGRTLANLIEYRKIGKLLAPISLVISSNPTAFGLEIAKGNNIPTAVVSRRDFKTDKEFSNAVTHIIEPRDFSLIIMAGFVHLYLFPPKWFGKVLNIHPALLPKFGGKGFYGSYVHEAVIKAGETETGPTVHFADLEYDHGPVILQGKVEVLNSDTPETLAEKVFKKECEIYPEAINLVMRGKITSSR